jgi:hypothetical protein
MVCEVRVEAVTKYLMMRINNEPVPTFPFALLLFNILDKKHRLDGNIRNLGNDEDP